MFTRQKIRLTTAISLMIVSLLSVPVLADQGDGLFPNSPWESALYSYSELQVLKPLTCLEIEPKWGVAPKLNTKTHVIPPGTYKPNQGVLTDTGHNKNGVMGMGFEIAINENGNTKKVVCGVLGTDIPLSDKMTGDDGKTLWVSKERLATDLDCMRSNSVLCPPPSSSVKFVVKDMSLMDTDGSVLARRYGFFTEMSLCEFYNGTYMCQKPTTTPFRP